MNTGVQHSKVIEKHLPVCMKYMARGKKPGVADPWIGPRAPKAPRR